MSLLGYRLYPAFWGRGLATEGARALIRLAFEQLHLDRVAATMMADNTGSWRVMEKCGLRRVGTFYYPDAHLMPGGEHGDFGLRANPQWLDLTNQEREVNHAAHRAGLS